MSQIGGCCPYLLTNDIILADGSSLLQYTSDDSADNCIHLFCPICRRTVADIFMLCAVIAFIDDYALRFTDFGVVGPPCGRRKNATTTVAAINITGKETLSGVFSGIAAWRARNKSFLAILSFNDFWFVRRCVLFEVFFGSLISPLLHSLKLIRCNDLQIRKNIGNAFTTSQDAGIGYIDKNILNR